MTSPRAAAGTEAARATLTATNATPLTAPKTAADRHRPPGPDARIAPDVGERGGGRESVTLARPCGQPPSEGQRRRDPHRAHDERGTESPPFGHDTAEERSDTDGAVVRRRVP